MADKDAVWANQNISDAKLNVLSVFHGTTLPATNFPVDALFLKEGDNLYRNTGTFAVPIWTAAIQGMPIGSVTMYVGAAADIPTNWFLCNGQAISRTTYATLFAIIDTEYGTGDGSTTFNVPDFVTSNRFPRGATNDVGRGTTGGESTHVLSTAEMPSHTHIQNAHNHTGIAGNIAGSGAAATTSANQNSTITAAATATNQNTGGGAAHENKPPFLDIQFIIKAL